ncbi:MAG: IclR family transcriptional regulator, partial [Bacillota bacterium]
IEWDAQTGRYQLGLGLFELGSLVVATAELRKVARPVLESIHSACGETVHLAILDEGDVVYIDKIESRNKLRMYSEVGRRAPAHCTGLGKVLLAHLPDGELQRVIDRKGLRAYTSRTITSAHALREHLARVRLQGYAVDAGEHEELVRCAAAPVFDHMGKALAAVSVAAVAVEVGSARFEELISLVRDGAHRISAALGYQAGTAPPVAAQNSHQPRAPWQVYRVGRRHRL